MICRVVVSSDEFVCRYFACIIIHHPLPLFVHTRVLISSSHDDPKEKREKKKEQHIFIFQFKLQQADVTTSSSPPKIVMMKN